MDDQLKQSALDFHEFPVPGKIQVSPTKPLATQRDLALAYSPGVARHALKSKKIRWRPTNTLRAATWLPLFLTARRCWA
jgi:malic enzyme